MSCTSADSEEWSSSRVAGRDQGGARLQALRTTSSGGYGVYIGPNDSRPLAPPTVVLHVSHIYTHHFNCILYSNEEVLSMSLHV